MKQILTLLFILGTSLSCSNSTLNSQQDFDENNYVFSITKNSLLVLNQPITIQANLGRSYFQNGKLIPEHHVNIYYPHCSITVNTIMDHARTISPTTFKVTKVVNGEEYAQGYMLFADSNLKLASDGPIISGLVSYYFLHSDTETDIRTLECIQWDSLYENNYLSITEIRKSLGELFTLNLN